MTKHRVGSQGCLTPELAPRLLGSQDRAAQPMPGLRRALPLPAARETVEQMVSVKPAGFHASVARDGYLQDLDKVEAAPPPGPSRPPHPPGTKPLASHQSSLTSLEGSGLSEHLPQKSLHQAGGPHLEVSICAWSVDLLGISAPGPLLTPFQNACCSQSLPGTILPQHSGLMPGAASLL